MNRMTGIGLMIGGALIFIIGIAIYATSNKLSNATAQVLISGKKQVSEKKQKQVNEMPDMELEKVIQVAIADGVLTDNERKIIVQTAAEKGLDTEEAIKKAEQQITESETETELIDFNKKRGDDFEKFIIQKFNKKYYRIKEWVGDKYINGVHAETTQQPDLLIERKIKEGNAEFWVECKWRQNLFKGGIEFATEEQLKRYKLFQKKRSIPIFLAIGLGNKASSPKHLFILPLEEIETNFILLETLKKNEKNITKDFFYDIETKDLR